MTNEIVTPEMKAKIAKLFEDASDREEEQSEFIGVLQKRLSIAEGVCYTAKGLIEHGNDPLGAVYLDVLKTKIKRWIDAKAEPAAMYGWISVKERLPESGEAVLTYYFDEGYDIHQIGIHDYFRKDAVMDESVDFSIASPEERLLDTLFNSNRQIKAPEDGFYIYEGAREKPWRKHADIITHWQPLPTPPSTREVQESK